jgi:hypothetical protein
MQEGFGRNASTIQANAAGIHFRVNERDLHAHIGGEESGGISSWSATYDCDVHFRRVVH